VKGELKKLKRKNSVEESRPPFLFVNSTHNKQTLVKIKTR